MPHMPPSSQNFQSDSQRSKHTIPCSHQAKTLYRLSHSNRYLMSSDLRCRPENWRSNDSGAYTSRHRLSATPVGPYRRISRRNSW